MKTENITPAHIGWAEKHSYQLLQINPTIFNAVQSKKPTLNSLPLYQQNPTQPTTNRKTKTDFGEKDFNTEDALHICAQQAEYLWA